MPNAGSRTFVLVAHALDGRLIRGREDAGSAPRVREPGARRCYDPLIMVKRIAQILQGKGGDVLCIGPRASVYQALERMAEHNVGAIVVADLGSVVGILSERDYARKVILMARGSKDTRVEEIMTPNPVTVRPSATVGECMQLMSRMRIRHLPVVEFGQLLGIISIGDVVNAVMEEQQHTIEQLENYITH